VRLIYRSDLLRSRSPEESTRISSVKHESEALGRKAGTGWKKGKGEASVEESVAGGGTRRKTRSRKVQELHNTRGLAVSGAQGSVPPGWKEFDQSLERPARIPSKSSRALFKADLTRSSEAEREKRAGKGTQGRYVPVSLHSAHFGSTNARVVDCRRAVHFQRILSGKGWVVRGNPDIIRKW